MNGPRDFGGHPPPPREPDERLADWVDGCMSERERERFTAELRVNPQLRADLAAYERTVATLREALRAPTAPLPRRDTAGGGTTLADRVLAQVAGQAPGRSLRRAGGGIAWRPVLWSLASAAALLLLTLLLDSWSAEPAATRESAVTSLDASIAKTVETGTAVPLEQGIDQVAPFRRESAAADRAAAAPAAPPAEELAEEAAKNQAAAGAGGAAKLAEGLLGRDKLEQPAPMSGKPDSGDQPESMKRVQTRRMAEPPARSVVAPDPAAPEAAAPAPSPEVAQPAAATDESKDKRAVDSEAGVPAPGAPGNTGGQPVPGGQAGTIAPTGAADRAKTARAAPGGRVGATEEPPPSPAGPEREGALVDSSRAGGDDFYLGSSRKQAVALWPLLLIEGIEAAPAPVTAGGRGAKPAEQEKSRGAANGSAGPATSGPATSGPAGPASGGPSGVAAGALNQIQLLARIDAFLAAAVQTDAAPVLELPTATGTLRLVRLPSAEAPADRVPLAPEAKVKPAAAPMAADWAVEGPEVDVAVLLRRVDLFARAPGRSLSSGEVAAPTLPPAPVSSAAAATPSTQRQLVLRFRVRSR